MTVVLVTGADRGIGLEICRQLADRDVTVLLCARHEADARAAASELWDEGLDSVAPRTLDVRRDGSVRRLAELVKGEFGVLDALVTTPEEDLGEAGQAAAAQRCAAGFAALLGRSEHARVIHVPAGSGPEAADDVVAQLGVA